MTQSLKLKTLCISSSSSFFIGNYLTCSREDSDIIVEKKMSLLQSCSKECFKFSIILWLFKGTRFLDSSWSWVVCVSAAVCSSVNVGFTLSFGVLLPELMAYFDETRERTGKTRCQGNLTHFTLSNARPLGVGAQNMSAVCPFGIS